MRKITKEYEVAEFKELNKKQKAMAISNYSDINVDHDWFRYDIEEYEKDLKILGFKNPKIKFELDSRSGGGVEFNKSFDSPESASESKKRLSDFKDQCGIEDFSRLAEELFSRKFNRAGSDLDDEFIEELGNKYEKAIHKHLSAQYEFLVSDEAIGETLEINEYEFDTTTLKIFKL